MRAFGRQVRGGLLGVLGLVLGACPNDQSHGSGTQAPSRVVAVAAGKRDSDARGLCDELPPGAKAAEFSFPPLTSPAPAAKAGHFRWVNLWATWCPPCVEELALIKRFAADLNKAGKPVDLVLLSVDQTDEVVTAYQAKHSEARGSLRVKEPLSVEDWLSGLGLSGSAALPIHLFAGPDNKLRCVRSGALNDGDFARIEALLAAH